jgi:hypothetical protein
MLIAIKELSGGKLMTRKMLTFCAFYIALQKKHLDLTKKNINYRYTIQLSYHHRRYVWKIKNVYPKVKEGKMQ